MGPKQSRLEPGTGSFFGSWSRLAHEDETLSDDPEDVSPELLRLDLLTFLVDAAKLGDLQLQLLTVDAKAFWNGAWKAVVALAVGTAVLIAAIPVGLLGLAELLHDAMKWPLEYALLAIAGVVVLAAVGLMAWSAWSLFRSLSHLKNSTEELRENLGWIRSELHAERKASVRSRAAARANDF